MKKYKWKGCSNLFLPCSTVLVKEERKRLSNRIFRAIGPGVCLDMRNEEQSEKIINMAAKIVFKCGQNLDKIYFGGRWPETYESDFGVVKVYKRRDRV